ncbi:uncharacterized protein EV154DRAFT_484708 [Mucor mucedo]|uniref:uncharacterized protein n=1 Tax=Mucor mucedo TaxID=29922 RepID=UPI00221EC504|nr:uncharacterized protein EV154DRAFT_484708 [Mucor mucedo]KAI7887805.1 hypothetical protein EV154DRAFT_484708 [Mucor mucedo]
MTNTSGCTGKDLFERGMSLYNNRRFGLALQTLRDAIDSYDLPTNEAGRAEYIIHVIHLKGYGTSLEYNQAVDWLMEHANEGCIHALFEVGSVYMQNKRCQNEEELGREYVLESAEKGNIAAQLFLGSFYQKYGIHRDFEKSLYWLKQAAVVDNREDGDSPECFKAHYLIGLVYKRGLGVPVDLKLALHWFEKSSNGNYGLGRLEKGLIRYFSGAFGPIEEKAGMEWLQKLANNGSAYAQAELGKRFCKKFTGFCDYKKAMYWFQKAVDSTGNSTAQYGIGLMYKKGWGVEINYNTAVSWFKKAADEDNSNGQFALGRMYTQGKGLKQDWHEGVNCYKKSVENGDNPKAQYHLSQCYYKGRGTLKDTKLGLELLTSSVEQGNYKAQKRFSSLYDKGGFTRTNSSKALALFKKSISNDASSFSLYNIGSMFVSGSGVPKNFGLAIEYYTKSAEMGNKNAIRESKRLQLIEDSKKLMDSVNEDPDETDLILSSLKNTSNQDDATKRKIDKAILFHVEDTRSAILLKTDESPKFFHVCNTRTTVINNNDEGPHFFHVENTRAINVDFNPRISNAFSFYRSGNYQIK